MCEDYEKLKAQKLAILAKMPEPVDLRHSGLLQTIQDYYITVVGMEYEEFEKYCDSLSPEDKKEDALIQQILAMDAVFYISRRVPSLAGECIDAINDLRHRLRREYRESFGEYVDPNENVDF